MEQTAAFDETADVREEPEIRRVRSCQLLPVACSPTKVHQTFLFGTGGGSGVASVTIRHQRPGKITAEDVATDLTGSRCVILKVNEIRVGVHPKVCSRTISRPIGFIGMDRTVGDF